MAKFLMGFVFNKLHTCSVSNRTFILHSAVRKIHTNNLKYSTTLNFSFHFNLCFKKNVSALKIKYSSVRFFRTSEIKKVHPVIWVVIKPILKLTAVLSGRGIRKWWQDLPPNKRKYFINKIKKNKKKITIWSLAGVILALGYYTTHLEEAPITGRVRFMAFNPKQMEKINQYELQHIMNQIEPMILPPSHPTCKRVKAIVKQILDSNTDVKEVQNRNWGVTVIESNIENAFVLPVGQVFVFTGMLKLCSNDDQLGIILSHEIAHCIQNHGAENVSYTHILDLFSIIIITFIWAIVPSDIISLLTHWLYGKLLEIMFHLPYNRKLETEADYVGLQLAAKACFDVRESSAFWSKMALLNKTFGKDPQIEFLSTHPNHEKRSEYLDIIMDQALKIRSDCDCPKLKHEDPRKNVETVSKALQRSRGFFFENHPKQVIVFKN